MDKKTFIELLVIHIVLIVMYFVSVIFDNNLGITVLPLASVSLGIIVRDYRKYKAKK